MVSSLRRALTTQWTVTRARCEHPCPGDNVELSSSAEIHHTDTKRYCRTFNLSELSGSAEIHHTHETLLGGSLRRTLRSTAPWRRRSVAGVHAPRCVYVWMYVDVRVCVCVRGRRVHASACARALRAHTHTNTHTHAPTSGSRARTGVQGPEPARVRGRGAEKLVLSLMENMVEPSFAPTALAACCGYDLCFKYIWYSYFAGVMCQACD